MSDNNVTKEVFELHMEHIEKKIDDSRIDNTEVIRQLSDVAIKLSKVVDTNEEVEQHLPAIRFWSGVYSAITESLRKFLVPALLLGATIAVLGGLGYNLNNDKEDNKDASISSSN